MESPPSTTGPAHSPSLRGPLTGPEQQRVRHCLVVLAVLGSGSLVGVASSLYLVNAYPLLLIALSPIGRHLLLVAPVVDPVAFVALAVSRRAIFYLPCFLLGRTLGTSALSWIEARAAYFARLVRWLERVFAHAPRLVVLVLPGPSVSVLAGISGMRLRVFVPLMALGTVVRMLLFLYFGDWLSTPLEALRSLIYEYWVPGTVLIVAIIAFQRWRRRPVTAGPAA